MAQVGAEVRGLLAEHGSPVVGFADLRVLDIAARQGFDTGIVFGLPHSREAMVENAAGSPRRYYAEFLALNDRLAELSTLVAGCLVTSGYKAWAKTMSAVVEGGDLRTVLPHKTVATLSGVGWIGKPGVLVTREVGSALRLGVVLTDAPLEYGTPVTASACPDHCQACLPPCPGRCISGRQWAVATEDAQGGPVAVDRDALLDPFACRTAARARACELLGVNVTVCGLCLAHCPFTMRGLGYRTDDIDAASRTLTGATA